MPDSQHTNLFNPETIFVPTAGYSQVAEIKSGKLVYIAGQVPSTNLRTWSEGMTFLLKLSRCFAT
jgi:enamine deaminase RidA (YjgF/YER057c/UK114 family)